MYRFGESIYLASLEIEIERDYKISTFQFSLLTFLFFGCGTLCAPFFGFWANAQGRRYQWVVMVCF